MMEMDAPTVEDYMIVAHHLSGNCNRTGREIERDAMGRSLPSSLVFLPVGAVQVRATCQLVFPPSMNTHSELRMPACEHVFGGYSLTRKETRISLCEIA